MKRFFILIFAALAMQFLYGQSKEVLVEVFTNSHCSVCPNAHNALNAYIAIPANSTKINFLYYHMAYPYADDKLNQDNKTDPAGRSNYYGNFASTPVVFFDGEHQPNTYSQWPATLTTLANQITPLSISLSIIETGAVYTAKASVIELASVGTNPLKIHFVLAENVYYAGRNGITHHDYVVRKMLTWPSGIDFVPGGGTTITEQSFALQSGWITDSLSLCVFVQDAVSKKILQSESMKLSSLLTAIRHTNENMDLHFALEQNYPNPFNPSTTITFSVPTNAYTTLKVYSTTGEVIKTVAEGFIEQGTHSFSISLAGMPSGLYLYRLISGNKSLTKKMLYLK